MASFKINNNFVGENHPTYFIADIAANHDGDLDRAKKLIELAKESGAQAVKFQHHDVRHYVNDFGFKNLGQKFSHQKKWKKTIFEVYKDAEVPRDWTPKLKDFCNKVDIDFFSTPYDLSTVDHLDEYVPAYKIGSGDLNWDLMLKKVASKNKPVFLATGASTISEVKHAHDVIKKINPKFCIMQCNTNYTGSLENFKYININVLKDYKKQFKDTILGLSDHTPGHETVLGAIALGAKSVEKHFTDDNSRPGPDHPFSMNPKTWKDMVLSTRHLEQSLGDGEKKLEENENDTVVLQRRAIRAKKDLSEGQVIKSEDFEFQRPCPKDALPLNEFHIIVGKKLNCKVKKNEYLKKSFFNG